MRLFSLLLFCALAVPLGCSSEDSFENDQARSDCKRGCSDLNRGVDVCAPGDVLSECNRACLGVAPTDASSFSDCVDGHFFDDPGDCSVAECLSTLDVSSSGSSNSSTNGSTNSAGGDATTCKSNCDTIEIDCPDETDAGITSDCKAACDSSGSDAVQSFNSCSGNNRYICTDLIPCYDHLGVFL